MIDVLELRYDVCVIKSEQNIILIQKSYHKEYTMLGFDEWTWMGRSKTRTGKHGRENTDEVSRCIIGHNFWIIADIDKNPNEIERKIYNILNCFFILFWINQSNKKYTIMKVKGIWNGGKHKRENTDGKTRTTHYWSYLLK